MDDITLRTCEFRDIDRVAAIEKIVFPERPYSEVDFAWFLLSATEGFLVACEGEHVVGYVIAVGEGGRGVIQSIGVLPEFRRKRIGESLMIAALNHLAKKYAEARLLVDENNADAISLYHKLRFVETGNRIRRYYPNGDDAVEMVRGLEPR